MNLNLFIALIMLLAGFYFLYRAYTRLSDTRYIYKVSKLPNAPQIAAASGLSKGLKRLFWQFCVWVAMYLFLAAIAFSFSYQSYSLYTLTAQ